MTARYLIAILFLAALIAPASAGTGVWMNIYPGSFGYGAKIWLQDLSEWFTWNPQAKATLMVLHAEERLAEAQTMVVRGHLDRAQEAFMRHIQKLSDATGIPEGASVVKAATDNSATVVGNLLNATNQSDSRYSGLQTAYSAIQRHRESLPNSNGGISG